MNFGIRWTRVWALCAAYALTGCGSTTGAGAAGGVVQDVAPDLSLSFGSKDAAAGKDTTAVKDLVAAEDAAQMDDSAGTDEDAVVDDAPQVDDAAATDEDVNVADTGVADVKDTSTAKDTVVKDTGTPKDTGTGKDTSTADVSGTCGNGTCDAGETCENCAVDCTCKPCNPLTSSGCTASQQCYVNGANLQCGGFGTVADGGTCKYLNDCALGSMCVGSICRKVCATAGSLPKLSCTLPAVCEELGSGSVPLGYNLGACFAPDNCNLITSSGCAVGLACFPASNGKQCSPAGAVGLDGVCKTVSDCAAGFLCLNNSAGAATCKKRCNTTDASTCPSGLTCNTITIGTPPVLVGENFGVCDVPVP